MKKTKDNPVIIKIVGKDTNFTARIPLWKAHYILANVEKEEYDKIYKKKSL